LERRLVPQALVVSLLLNAGAALACQVPVFRYALEHWEPDIFEALAVHRGPLAAAEEALIEKLRRASVVETSGEGSANLRLRLIDLERGDAGLAPYIELAGLDGLELPALFLRGPRRPGQGSGQGGAIWSEKLSEDAVAALIDSPLRRRVASSLLAGDSAVWVLIESGDREADGAAFARLETSLRKLEKTLELPAPEKPAAGREAANGPELRISFPIVKLSRADPAERVFAALLLAVEPDLVEYSSKPIAVPVFGRGRALYGFTGEGIHEDTIEEACRLLAGPCSCTVKEQNPGADLLLAVRWPELMETALPGDPAELPAMAAVELPREESYRESSARDGYGSEDGPIAERAEPGATAGADLLLPLLAVAAAGFAVAALGTIFLRRGREN
jgi:hypothetical protein